MNSDGEHAAHLGMVPARQRLEAGDGAVLEPHDRLIEDRDLVALERAPQLGFQRRRSVLRARIDGLNTSMRSPPMRLA